MDWLRFGFDYRLDLPGMMSVLVRIEGRKEAAMSLLLPSEWKEQLDVLNRIRTIHGSTALEGNPLSEAQIADFLGGKLGLDVEGREVRQIQNADIAQDWVRRRFGPGRPPVTVQDILQMHELMTRLSDEADNVPGALRSHGVQVGTEALGGVHRGAPHEDLPRLLHEFVEFVNSGRFRSEHPVVRALVAHFFLVTIHPFGDGNGRVSRLVEAAILYEGGYNVHGFYGLSNYFYRNGDEYKRRLQACRRTQPFDLASFVEFGLRGFEAELRGINRFIKTKLNRLVYRDTLNRGLAMRVSKRRHLLNIREYSLLSFLLDETEPTDPFSERPSTQIRLSDLVNSPYVRGAYLDVTQRTFIREIRRLAELGFISLEEDPATGHQLVGIDFNAIEIDFEEIAPY
ncbi:MAG: Fic family protein [Gemmatimonadetes bacterium]|nr:Fic family protein [Gemmatimonadota bacterium]